MLEIALFIRGDVSELDKSEAKGSGVDESRHSCCARDGDAM